ncbi:MAG: PEP-CTERM sorting domain-containing protein, partial [Novosphingobium sp.]|nr:PEP-CTERM sorting domain-containing protein [Novosphingobium sp.]
MAIAKLSCCLASSALIGGGAVHVAEKPAAGKPQYVKLIKTPHVRRHVIHRHIPKPKIRRIRRIIKTTTRCCAPAEQMALIPYMPPP